MESLAFQCLTQTRTYNAGRNQQFTQINRKRTRQLKIAICDSKQKSKEYFSEIPLRQESANIRIR